MSISGRDLRQEAQIVADITAAVADTLESNGTFSCVLGSRLLLDALTDMGVKAEAVGATLYVLDPDAAAGRIGVGLRVGGTGGRGKTAGPGWFDGHVVVCTRGRVIDWLADPSIGQLAQHEQTWEFVGTRTSWVARLHELWPSAENPEVVFEHDGWQLVYEHAPDLDWRNDRSWNPPERPQLAAEVRRRVEAKGHRFPAQFKAGRNEPCPCGSGLKWKFCHGKQAARNG